MIRRPTVLVLGAGASMPYGFPAGEGLYRQLTEVAATPGPRRNGGALELSDPANTVRALGLADADTLHDFTEALRWSGVKSVDQFLEHRPDFLDVGRLCIAAALVRQEALGLVVSHPDSDSWYRELWAALDTAPDRIVNNPLTVVTFNYDRSLEAFLAAALRGLHGLSMQDALNVVDNLPIIHVHGQLGKLTLEAVDGGRPYKQSTSAEEIRTAARGIQVVSEVKDDTPGFERAREVIAKAERVYFLGFGYHSDSVRRLGFGPDSPSQTLDLRGTIRGLTPLQVHAVVAMFSPNGRRFIAGGPGHGAREFLTHDVRLGG